MPRPPFLATLRQFQIEFATEEACQKYLAQCRWPEGFICPRCAHRRGYTLAGEKRWECAAYGYQVSLTSGTVLHNAKTPLTLWFWAACLMTTDKRGVSALLLQELRQAGEFPALVFDPVAAGDVRTGGAKSRKPQSREKLYRPEATS